MRYAPALHGRDHWHGADHLYRPRTLLAVIDGIGSPIAAGIAGDVTAHYDCTIQGWRLLADQAGDIVVDIWKTDYASFPPTGADSITGSEQPTLSGVDKDEGTTLVGWTVAVVAGDTFRINVDSAATVTRVTLALLLRV